MAVLDQLFEALDERRVVREVTDHHDGFRAAFSLPDNKVTTFEQYYSLLGDYFGGHYSSCVANGGRMSRHDAIQSARNILEREYRRRGGDIVAAFSDARDGLNGGMRVQLDHICEALKAEAIERYVQHVFDTLVGPHDWNAKVEVIRQYLDRCSAHLPANIEVDNPERYARDYRDLIRGHTMALQQVAARIRRL